MEKNNQAIADLNDLFRQTGAGGRCVITAGVHALGAEKTQAVVAAVRSFDDFTPDNDSHKQHDFGRVVVGEEAFFWKINYYDKDLKYHDLKYHSSDPADQEVTERVLTIMQVGEY